MKKVNNSEKIFLLVLSSYLILLILTITTIKTAIVGNIIINDQMKEMLHYFELIIIPLLVIPAIIVPYTFTKSSLWIKDFYTWFYYRKSVNYWKSKRKYLFWGGLSLVFLMFALLLGASRFWWYFSYYVESLVNPLNVPDRVTRSLPGTMLLFGIPLLFISIYFIIRDMINSKTVPLIAILIQIIIILFFGVPSIMDYWLYYINNPMLTIAPTLLSPLGLWQDWNYSHVNLIFSSFITFILLTQLFGSIQHHKKIQYEHKMRVLRTEEAILTVMSDFPEKASSITNISLEKMTNEISISQKEIDEQIKTMRKKYSKDWKTKSGKLTITPEMKKELTQERKRLRKKIITNHRFTKLEDIVNELRSKKLPINQIKKDLLLDTPAEVLFILNTAINKPNEILSMVDTGYVTITLEEMVPLDITTESVS